MFSLLRPRLGILFYSKVSLCSFPAVGFVLLLLLVGKE